MTGGAGSKPVYSYNRGKRVRENAYVREMSRFKKAFSTNNRKIVYKKKTTKKQKKRSSNSKYKQGISRFIQKLLK